MIVFVYHEVHEDHEEFHNLISLCVLCALSGDISLELDIQQPWALGSLEESEKSLNDKGGF